MKKKSSGEKSPVRDMGTLAIMLTVNKILDAVEKRRYARDSEKVLQRKLLVVSLIYHAIGIVYND